MNKRALLFDLLGDKPEPGDLKYRLKSKQRNQNYEHLIYEVNLLKDEQVEVQITVPLSYSSLSPLPLVICNHSHGGNYQLGKLEVINGNHYLAPVPFATELSDLGFITVSIDSRGFGTRNKYSESELVKKALLYGQTLWGLMLYDLQYLLDFLYSQDVVAFDSVGMIGMSMGGLQSWWSAAIDQRVEWVVDIAGQVKLETIIENHLLNKHGHYYYVPKLLKYYSTEDLQSLIIPRRRLSLVGNQDGNCPLKGVLELDRYLKQAYTNNNQSNNWRCIVSDGQHEETQLMRQQWVDFLKGVSKC